MRLLIDNLDGRGAVDYTASVAAEGRCRVLRRLNAPATCEVEIVCGLQALAVPVRRARVMVLRADTSVAFTGYLTTDPLRLYTGEASAQSLYRARLTAASDEWLLDRAGAGTMSSVAVTSDARAAVGLLTSRVQNGTTALAVESAGAALRGTGVVTLNPRAAWSSNARAAASASYAGYRAVGGQIMLQPAGSVTHAVTDADDSLSSAALEMAAASEMANDVTVSGALEPGAYVTEEFTGDGTTAKFTLSGQALREGAELLIEDAFDQQAIDQQMWAVSDPGNHLQLGGAGLMLNGGTGHDGDTTLMALDTVELGGVLTATLAGVSFGAASDGMLSGFYSGSPELTNCFAGWRVRQSTSATGGQTIVVPLVDGVEAGTAYTPVAGHLYTLRLRLHCAETVRVGQVYYAMVDGEVRSFGSAAGIDAPMDVVFELIDQGNASNTPATVLYDSHATTGPLVGTPAVGSFVAVDATQLFGSIASVQLRQSGGVWIVSVPPGGAAYTRLMGTAGEGVDCVVEDGSSAVAGTVLFLDGRVPLAGERLTVSYRRPQRSVARLMDAVSIANEASLGGTGVSRWMGRVLAPAARSSADCESAAAAILAVATSRSEALRGRYVTVNPPDDWWPGDVLQVTSAGTTTALLLREVVLQDEGTLPETVTYTAAFANDWGTQLADGLGLRLNDSIAADALLPAVALQAPPVLPPSLNGLSVTAVTADVLSLDAGAAAPGGGSFEVRRRDGGWGQQASADFVMRSPVRTFSVPRAAVGERFYVRAVSAAGAYSRVSAEVVANSPSV